MKRLYQFTLIVLVLLLSSCEGKIQFNRTKSVQNPTIESTIQGVKSYQLIFNPKANGIIAFTLASGIEYKSEKLNASQLASVLTLLQSKGIQFDTKNEEFILNAATHE